MLRFIISTCLVSRANIMFKHSTNLSEGTIRLFISMNFYFALESALDNCLTFNCHKHSSSKLSNVFNFMKFDVNFLIIFWSYFSCKFKFIHSRSYQIVSIGETEFIIYILYQLESEMTFN